MAKKEDLLRALEEQEKRLLELLDKEDRTSEEVTEMTGLCDDVEVINKELVAINRSEGAVADIRKPQGDKPKQPDPNNGDSQEFRSFGEYLQAVAAASFPRGDGKIGQFPCGVYDRRLAGNDSELRTPSGMAESTPALGGFLVQEDFSSELFTKVHAGSILWQKCRNIPISGPSNSLKIPGIDETSRADGSRWGGIRTYWEEEAAVKTASKPKFMMVELSLKKMIGLSYATDELLQDASALGEIISTGFQEEFAFKLDDAVVRGTGAGQPLGILNAPSLVSISRGSTGTLADTDVLGCYARLYPASHPKAEWYTNVVALPNLMSMSSNDAGYENLWMPQGQIANAPYDTLMGKRINYIEQASAEADPGGLMLLDLSQYVTITKGGLQTAQSIHVKFTTDETVFRFVMRVDGQPLWNSALTPFKGTDTQSPFVTVAT